MAFEDYAGAKRVFVTDNGKVVVIGTTEDEGWWMQTADEYDQGPAGVTMEELRERVAVVQSAIVSSGLPKDNITAFALAVVGLDSAGWADGFNANDFHKGERRARLVESQKSSSTPTSNFGTASPVAPTSGPRPMSALMRFCRTSSTSPTGTCWRVRRLESISSRSGGCIRRSCLIR